jgi:ribosomal protein L39E
MSKKNIKKKMMLGKAGKRSRRIPLLAILRTHKRIESNMFRRDWRHRRIKAES